MPIHGTVSRRLQRMKDSRRKCIINPGFTKEPPPRLGKVCFDVAIVFTLYENVMKLLDWVWPTPNYS